MTGYRAPLAGIALLIVASISTHAQTLQGTTIRGKPLRG